MRDQRAFSDLAPRAGVPNSNEINGLGAQTPRRAQIDCKRVSPELANRRGSSDPPPEKGTAPVVGTTEAANQIGYSGGEEIAKSDSHSKRVPPDTHNRGKARPRKRNMFRVSAPAAQSSLYDGQTLLGHIVERPGDGGVSAKRPDGRKLGSFRDLREAMAALTAAARAGKP
jgi:hypothetical protein